MTRRAAIPLNAAALQAVNLAFAQAEAGFDATLRASRAEVERLGASLAQLQAEIEALRAELADKKLERESTLAEVARLQAIAHEQSTAHAQFRNDLQAQLDALGEQIAAAQQQREVLLADLALAREQGLVQHESAAAADVARRVAETRIEALTAELAQHATAHEASLAEVARLQSLLQERELAHARELNESESLAQALKVEIAAGLQQRDELMASLAQALEREQAQGASLQSADHERLAAATEMESLRAALVRQLAAHEASLTEGARLQSLLQERELAHAHALREWESQAQALKVEIAAGLQQRDELMASLAQAQGREQAQRAALHSADDARHAVASQAESLRAQLARQLAEHEGSRAEIARLQSLLHERELARAHMLRESESLAQTLKLEIAAVLQQRDELLASIAQAGARELEHRAKFASSEAARADALAQIEALRADLTRRSNEHQVALAEQAAHGAFLEGRLTELTKSQAALRQDLRAAESVGTAATMRAAAAVAAHRRAEDRATELGGELRLLEQRLLQQASDHAEQARRSSENLAAAQAQVQLLSSELRQLRAARESEALVGKSRDREIRVLKAQAGQAEYRLRAAALTSERLESELANRRDREIGLRARFEALEAERDTLQQAVDRASAEAEVPALAQRSITDDLTLARDAIETEEPAMNEPAMDIQHLHQLFGLHGSNFVREAYRLILGREPDPQGAAYFLGRVDGEHDKASVVYELATSAEGRARQQMLGGVAELIAARSPRRGRVAQWFQRMAQMMAGVEQLDASVDLLAQKTQGRLDRLEAQLTELGRALHQSTQASERESARMREQLAGMAGDLARCSLTLDTLPASLESQVAAALKSHSSMAARAPELAPAAAADAPSAKGLHLHAGAGPDAFLAEFAEGLGATCEARTLSASSAT